MDGRARLRRVGEGGRRWGAGAEWVEEDDGIG